MEISNDRCIRMSIPGHLQPVPAAPKGAFGAALCNERRDSGNPGARRGSSTTLQSTRRKSLRAFPLGSKSPCSVTVGGPMHLPRQTRVGWTGSEPDVSEVSVGCGAWATETSPRSRQHRHEFP